jgi:hypothetical protein
MTHTVCGQPVTFREESLPQTGDGFSLFGNDLLIASTLRLMVPHCPTCGRDVEDDDELSAGRPWELVEQKEDGK